jgi:glycosyltransferase involved in cell wall biosynthesis
LNILFSSCLTEWGGGEFWMLSTAEGLRDRGHDVHLACAEDSELGRRAEAAGLPVDYLRFHGDLDPKLSRMYWRLCKRYDIHTLCCNMDKVLRVAGPAARMAGASVVPRRGSESPLGSKISHRIAYLKVASGVIVNSLATRDTLLESAPWLPAEKVRVIYNGIHCERYERDQAVRERVRAEMGAGPQTRVIGMVGELTSRKNHMVVVSELGTLLDRFPDLQLWIAGDGPERRKLEMIATADGSIDSLKLLGFRKDVPDLLQGMDLFCHPAHREGFGYVIVEAMAAGLPVIVSSTSNLPELVPDGEAGLLCDPESASQWRRRMGKLLEDNTMSESLAAGGQARARKLYAFDRMLEEVEDYFGLLTQDKC